MKTLCLLIATIGFFSCILVIEISVFQWADIRAAQERHLIYCASKFASENLCVDVNQAHEGYEPHEKQGND